MLSFSHHPKHFDLLLHKGEIVTLHDINQSVEILCKQGALWITRSGDRNDYTLTVGEHFVPQKSSMVIIEAIDEACFSLENA